MSLILKVTELNAYMENGSFVCSKVFHFNFSFKFKKLIKLEKVENKTFLNELGLARICTFFYSLLMFDL